ncbi:class I SAM-dependent methyltransferase [Agromyces tropicus]|uniref:Class I SAM-dependent methyltransferase n=1 Tax=Agromyces tropicus TaxID=555371 RepID=A0ABN2U5Z6_9MICO
MSAPPFRPAPPAGPSTRVPPHPAFGAGNGEPYLRLLAGQDLMPGLTLRGADGVAHRLDAGSWVRPAGDADLDVLDRVAGPVLDVGCGPGRMLHAAASRSLPALGIDVAPHAVARARLAGGLALHRSVFDRLPLEGRWQTVLLMDGNIGIGGDPSALLRRCAELAHERGSVVIEADPDPELAIVGECIVVDDEGCESSPFPWARVGWSAIRTVAADAGLAVAEHWDASGRHFVRVARSARRTRVRDVRSASAATQSTTVHTIASARP